MKVEQSLVELRLTGRGQDGVRWGSRLLGKLKVSQPFEGCLTRRDLSGVSRIPVCRF